MPPSIKDLTKLEKMNKELSNNYRKHERYMITGIEDPKEEMKSRLAFVDAYKTEIGQLHEEIKKNYPELTNGEDEFAYLSDENFKKGFGKSGTWVGNGLYNLMVDYMSYRRTLGDFSEQTYQSTLDRLPKAEKEFRNTTLNPEDLKFLVDAPQEVQPQLSGEQKEGLRSCRKWFYSHCDANEYNVLGGEGSKRAYVDRVMKMDVSQQLDVIHTMETKSFKYKDRTKDKVTYDVGKYVPDKTKLVAGMSTSSRYNIFKRTWKWINGVYYRFSGLEKAVERAKEHKELLDSNYKKAVKNASDKKNQEKKNQEKTENAVSNSAKPGILQRTRKWFSDRFSGSGKTTEQTEDKDIVNSSAQEENPLKQPESEKETGENSKETLKETSEELAQEEKEVKEKFESLTKNLDAKQKAYFKEKGMQTEHDMVEASSELLDYYLSNQQTLQKLEGAERKYTNVAEYAMKPEQLKQMPQLEKGQEFYNGNPIFDMVVNSAKAVSKVDMVAGGLNSAVNFVHVNDVSMQISNVNSTCVSPVLSLANAVFDLANGFRYDHRASKARHAKQTIAQLKSPERLQLNTHAKVAMKQANEISDKHVTNTFVGVSTLGITLAGLAVGAAGVATMPFTAAGVVAGVAGFGFTTVYNHHKQKNMASKAIDSYVKLEELQSGQRQERTNQQKQNKTVGQRFINEKLAAYKDKMNAKLARFEKGTEAGKDLQDYLNNDKKAKLRIRTNMAVDRGKSTIYRFMEDKDAETREDIFRHLFLKDPDGAVTEENMIPTEDLKKYYSDKAEDMESTMQFAEQVRERVTYSELADSLGMNKNKTPSLKDASKYVKNMAAKEPKQEKKQDKQRAL